MRNPYDILVQPLFTEKSTALREKGNKLCFIVYTRANKAEIKRAVEEALKVKVEKINTIRVSGKQKKVGRFAGKKPDWKKAVITLKEGERVELFEGV